MYSLPTHESQSHDPQATLDTGYAGTGQPSAAHPSQEQVTHTYVITEAVISAALRSELSRRIEAIMNYRPSPETIYANPVTLVATISLNGSLFRLEGERLALIRPCAYCGTGEFRSIPLTDLADLAYALAVWEPLHPDCREADPVGWLDS